MSVCLSVCLYVYVSVCLCVCDCMCVYLCADLNSSHSVSMLDAVRTACLCLKLSSTIHNPASCSSIRTSKSDGKGCAHRDVRTSISVSVNRVFTLVPVIGGPLQMEKDDKGSTMIRMGVSG